MENLDSKKIESIIKWLNEGGEKPPYTDQYAYELSERIRLKNAQLRREKRKISIPKSLTIKGLLEEIQDDKSRGKPLETSEKNHEYSRIIPKVGSMKEAEIGTTDKEGFKERELDSADVAKTILQCGNIYDTPLSNSKVLVILYDLYGEWLAVMKERLTSDRPQAWKFGPVFPRAYNGLKKDQDIRERHDFIRKTQPELYAVIADMVSRIPNKPSWANSEVHTTVNTPWDKTYKENEKCGAVIQDDIIYEWFKKSRSKC